MDREKLSKIEQTINVRNVKLRLMPRNNSGRVITMYDINSSSNESLLKYIFYDNKFEWEDLKESEQALINCLNLFKSFYKNVTTLAVLEINYIKDINAGGLCIWSIDNFKLHECTYLKNLGDKDTKLESTEFIEVLDLFKYISTVKLW